MKKIKTIFSLMFIFTMILVLASCSKGSGVEAELSFTAKKTEIVIEAAFADNSNIKELKARPYVKIYTIDDNNKDVYKDKKEFSFTSGTYRKSTITFDSLTKDTEYAFCLYVTFNGKDEKISNTYKRIKTLKGSVDGEATVITTTAEFNDMKNDPEGVFELGADLDFKNTTISEMFTSSSTKQFKGTFDGKGYTIKNFKLASATNIGLFGYCNGATIKNVNVENAVLDYSTGRATANIGVIAGYTTKTLIENVKINGTSIKVQGNTSAELNIGSVVGFAELSAMKNIEITGTSLDLTRSRLKVSAGLVAGKIKGDTALVKGENTYKNVCENIYADGSLNVSLYYVSAEGYTFVGGFVGNVGTALFFRNCFVDSNITVSNEYPTGDRKFDLAVGGFMGINNEGNIAIEKCFAATSIKVYSNKLSLLEKDNTKTALMADITTTPTVAPITVTGSSNSASSAPTAPTASGSQTTSSGVASTVVSTTPTDTRHEYEKTQITLLHAYIGGFAGRTIATFNKIDSCLLIAKEEMVVRTLEDEKAGTKDAYLFVGEIVGSNTGAASKINVKTAPDTESDAFFALDVFSQEVQAKVSEYFEK